MYHHFTTVEARNRDATDPGSPAPTGAAHVRSTGPKTATSTVVAVAAPMAVVVAMAYPVVVTMVGAVVAVAVATGRYVRRRRPSDDTPRSKDQGPAAKVEYQTGD